MSEIQPIQLNPQDLADHGVVFKRHGDGVLIITARYVDAKVAAISGRALMELAEPWCARSATVCDEAEG